MDEIPDPWYICTIHDTGLEADYRIHVQGTVQE